MLLSSRHSHNILLSSESDADKEVLSCRWKQLPFRPPSTIITSASPHTQTHRHYYLADFRVKHNSFARASASSGRARERGALLLYVRLTLFQAWKRVRPLSVSQFTVSHYGLSWLKESVYRVVTRPQLPTRCGNGHVYEECTMPPHAVSFFAEQLCPVVIRTQEQKTTRVESQTHPTAK